VPAWPQRFGKGQLHAVHLSGVALIDKNGGVKIAVTGMAEDGAAN
jgi:hypothetical protein